MFLKKSLSMAVFACFSSITLAQGLVLNDENLRTDLNWLNQQGVIQISTSTWPLSGDEIQRALAQAKVSNNTQQKVVNSVINSLKADNAPAKVGLHVGTDLKAIPQTFADNQKSQYQVAAEFNAGSENWDAKLRINGEKDPLIDNGHDANVEGSYFAGKLWNQWFIAGQIPTYWGPGHDGSLIRGDASRPVYGVTAQRAVQNAFETKWLSWIGPWQYQAFAGQLDDYKAIPDAKLLSLRLTAQPLPYLELGASRILQWGGEGRSESLDSLWNAIKGNDNFDSANDDKSNQIAGLDFRLNAQPLLQIPVGIYGQYVGEDEAGLLPAKKMYLAGADFSSIYKNMPYQLYAEWADTRTNGQVDGVSYNHYVYTDGYYQHGFPLGHAIGGDGQMYSVGGDIRFDVMNRLSGRALYAKVNQSNLAINAAFPKEDTIKGLDLTWTHYIKPTLPLKVNGWLSDSDLNGRDGGISVGVEIPLERNMFGF
ncbi:MULTISPECIES: capsule assembly Wzi family protein [unclassified Acinetobacter]|uniref:capsule assembly Wzi family protein n=1 Tax=unclassified Acinetobacter TaxID=196816 RepID=UPI00244687A8|nr:MULTISPECIES: capsule assembly Wzi family protein [unclassified Acinetobacter]MDH0030406.1 capsule assembly Wzi family protein [Acinetobacter sp. GD04021]MDH0885705.1 capsule assembly Wzi family protein [Acinetobacter sp. GD03873]MDH1081979.1 capsule assembly Wzi family protein [Acinetobacter sp. GD03983]MDH2188991.1 capsule assembly Wzi family protein [Acinetobacter sp. GD03645]MDH2202448.1 capsule assembly Wzi family protein [Acinetobacter sp. GD03647]